MTEAQGVTDVTQVCRVVGRSWGVQGEGETMLNMCFMPIVSLFVYRAKDLNMIS